MTAPVKHFLIASDFDQTLSFNDSGLVLSELLGVAEFQKKVAGLAETHLVQQGGELAALVDFLRRGIAGARFVAWSPATGRSR